MMALVLFVLPMAQVANAFRHEAVEKDKSNFCWQKCCSSKCGNQSFDLRGDLGGKFELRDCVVKMHEPQYHAKTGEAFCEENCTIFASEGAKTIQVTRKSGKGEQHCKPQLPVDGLCEHQCCQAKCTEQAYEKRGSWQFQDCSLVGRYDRGCEENCTVVHSGKPEHAQVIRQNGPGSPQCVLQETPQEVAADFIERLEKGPLRDGWYIGKRGGGVPWPRVKKFLKHVTGEVAAEYRRHGFSREVSSEVKDVAIIGDLHGQLFNLIAYLVEIKKKYEEKGYSSLDGSSLLVCDPRMQYIFLGDYLDRGERAAELLLLLLSYKVRCPHGLVLLQGNHEDESLWEHYGFQEELDYKFRGKIRATDISSVVRALPYVAVVPGQFMAMHGGLSPDIVKHCSGQAGKFSRCIRSVGTSTVWADPHAGEGWEPSPRGEGLFKFGLDVAKQFLKSNGLKGIYRGHEQVMEGYTSIGTPEAFVATVFSAADYMGVFCLSGRLPARPPPFEKDLFSLPGEDNEGAFVLADLVSGERDVRRMSGSLTRKLAANFTDTGAWCAEKDLMKHGSPDLESFIEKNHMRHRELGHEDSCTLGETETAFFKEAVRRILSTSKDQEFEARKLVDLQGEALVGQEDSFEVCRSMKKDQLTLEVYKQLRGPDEQVLEEDIELRAHELDAKPDE